MAVLIVGTEEFEQLVIFSYDDSDLCFTFAAITQQALHNSYPFFSSRVVIFHAMLLPEANVSWKLLMSRSLHQAALLHKFLHESVNVMIDFRQLLYGISAGGPPLDFSVIELRMVLAPLARRLDELFLDIGIKFGFGSSGIRLAMDGPVIAIGFRRRREAGRRS